jgi:hypothetical protein
MRSFLRVVGTLRVPRRTRRRTTAHRVCLLLGFLTLPPVGGAPAMAADAPSPSVTISLGNRQATATPTRQGFTHTGGGNIDVAQPTPDALVVTMTGVAVAGAHSCKYSVATLNFDLLQDFEITFEKPEIKKAKLTVEARLIGLLRSHSKGGGSAEVCAPHILITSGKTAIVAFDFLGRAVAGGENLSINDHQGPQAFPVIAGKYTLHQLFGITAAHSKNLRPCKAASAEFAPDPALDPLWISYWEPFHGANKKDFGFQITLKVTPENEAAPEKTGPKTR